MGDDAGVARFLSDDWLEDVAAAAAGDDDLAAATQGLHLTVEQVVTGTPDGEVRYAVALRDGRVEIGAAADVDPDVRFTTDWETAVALARGRRGAQDALNAGRLRIGGDLLALRRAADALSGLDRVFEEVRERTSYETG